MFDTFPLLPETLTVFSLGVINEIYLTKFLKVNDDEMNETREEKYTATIAMTLFTKKNVWKAPWEFAEPPKQVSKSWFRNKELRCKRFIYTMMFSQWDTSLWCGGAEIIYFQMILKLGQRKVDAMSMEKNL